MSIVSEIDPLAHAMALKIKREREQESGWKRPVSRRDNPRMGIALQGALENAVDGINLIADQQKDLGELLAIDIQDGQDPEWIKGREYQIWLVEQQLTRASELAQKRCEYLAQIRTANDVEAELAKCASDRQHWFEYYAWGFDPRPDSPLNTIPLDLFPFQKRYIDWLDYLVFRTRQSGVVPKSRDMGATEVALRWAVHNWLFKDSFEVLLLSRTEDEVDSKEDVNTLFEKVRFQMRLLPEWMLPDGFSLDKGMPYMRIKNPENGSTFHGRAPTESVGRQLRVAVILYDEHAFAPNGGYKQHTSLSQTSKSLIGLSSVGGRLNKFADLMTDNKTPQFVMDWREHPWKTEDWYNALGTGVFGVAMNAQQIAQEIDRDLDASQPGKVWKFREEYLFMTWEEVVGAFSKFNLADRFKPGDDHDPRVTDRIPFDWRWSRYHDYGQTEGHEWAYTVAARPKEFYPYHDTMFVFLGLELEPTGLTEEQAVGTWTEYEQLLGVRDKRGKFLKDPYSARNSHEQKDLRDVLRDDYGETWVPWNTDYIQGISTLQSWFNLIDKTKPNPFRPGLFGRSRIIFVAPNNEYKLAFDERNGAWFVTNSKTERGYKTLRQQLAAYHYPEEERGKDVKKMRPAKQFDDIVDTLRAMAIDHVLPEKKSSAEDVESRMPEHLKQAEVAQHYGESGFAELTVARIQEQRQIKQRIEEETREEQRKIQAVMGGGPRARLLGGRRRGKI